MVLQVRECFAGESVLLTGATGFMGKILVEKLLRSCPDIKRLYLLIRAKKGKSANDRLEEIFATKLFNQLQKECPKFRDKITILDGELSEPGLGLSHQDEEIVCSEIGIVIHSAATVRFDEPIDVAYNVNVRGTKQLLLLAKEFRCLKAFVYVSTAYSNCLHKTIEEKIYPPPMSHTKLEAIIDNVNRDLLIDLQPKLLGEWPNTYCFTKAIAEDAVRDLGKNLPVTIVRPGVVLNAAYDPLPGWVDNMFGPYGLLTGVYSGVVHTAYLDGDLTNSFVPVDMADSLIISSAAELVQDGRKDEDIKVYNYVCEPENPLNYRIMENNFSEVAHLYPSLNSLWMPFFFSTKHKGLYLLLRLLFHYLPATVLDSLVWFSGKKVLPTSMWSIYQRIDKYAEALQFFTLNSWNWKTTNYRNLWKNLSEEDQKTFRFDMMAIDWKEFFLNGLLGVRQYLLKDDLSTMPRAIIRYKWLTWAHYTIVFILSLILLNFALMLAPIVLHFSTAVYKIAV